MSQPETAIEVLLNAMSARIDTANMSSAAVTKFAVTLLHLLGPEYNTKLARLARIDEIEGIVTSIGVLSWSAHLSDVLVMAINITSTSSTRMVLCTSRPEQRNTMIRFRHNRPNSPRFLVEFIFKEPIVA